MLRRRKLNTIGMVLGPVLLLVGCGSADPVAPPEAKDETAEAVADGTATTPVEAPTPAAPSDHAQPRIIASAFTPPFPDRTEMFEPAKRAQSTVRREDESGNTVELKGFINVAGPKAVLSIDGVITPLSVGDEKYGVQVISIDGPTVVLQRGRSRWTATLE